MDREADPIPPAPPPIGTIEPIRDVSDEFVFRFELGPAILAQLLETLRRVPLVSIVQGVKEAKYPGFYQIFLDGKPKYIGKTSRRIAVRLREHMSKLRGRAGIRLEDVGCKYAFVEDPSLVDVSEGALIDYFGEHGLAEWNASGFGSKVPGYGRGRQIASKWSEEYAPDPAFPVSGGAEEPMMLYELVKQIASEAPITFSIPGPFRKRFRADHDEPIAVARETRPFIEWVELIEARLASGWTIDRQAPGWYIVRS